MTSLHERPTPPMSGKYLKLHKKEYFSRGGKAECLSYHWRVHVRWIILYKASLIQYMCCSFQAQNKPYLLWTLLQQTTPVAGVTEVCQT